MSRIKSLTEQKQKALEAIQNHMPDSTPYVGSANLPLISIIITNYNYAPYLEECIQSCLKQDYPHCEHILVDDCSTDSSLEIYTRYSEQFTLVKHEENKGQLAGFFSGLAHAKGEFVVFVDADDFLDEDAISAHLRLHLFESPPVGFSVLRNRQVSQNSAVLNDFHMDFMTHGKEISYSPPRIIHTPTWNWSTTSAMMFRKDLLDLITTDQTDDFRTCADYYIVHFANLLGGSILFDRSKVNYRRHGKNNFSKNFLIGGHRPTGHDKYHVHPSQKALQKAILDKLVLEREKYEPYFGSLFRYAETIAFVAEIDHVLKAYRLDTDLKKALRSMRFHIWFEKQKLIRTKKWALSRARRHCFFQKVHDIKHHYIQTYCK